MHRRCGFGLVVAALMFGLAAPLAAVESIVGVWLTEDRDSRIEFSECGDSVCGRIVWLERENDDRGLPYRDINNPDAALRGRTILGLTIFKNLKPDYDENGWRGTVYNPEDGDTYETIVSALPNRRLEVKGCVLGGFICDSEYWTRSENPAATGATD